MPLRCNVDPMWFMDHEPCTTYLLCWVDGVTDAAKHLSPYTASRWQSLSKDPGPWDLGSYTNQLMQGALSPGILTFDMCLVRGEEWAVNYSFGH
jgi:hypothetical protein